jgi:hypothetical protein
MGHWRHPASGLFSFFFLIASCTSSVATELPTFLPTESPVPSATSAPTEVLGPTETPTAFPTLTPDYERPIYMIDMQLNYAAKAAVVEQSITYPNWTGETLTNLVLAVHRIGAADSASSSGRE